MTPVHDAINKSEFLRSVALFSEVSTTDLENIGWQAKEIAVSPGEAIIREGDKDCRLFIIVSGKVRVVRNLDGPAEKVLRVMGTGEYLGEMALIDELTRSASVVAIDHCLLLSIGCLDLREEIEKCPALAIELLKALSRRIRAVEATVIDTLGSLVPICANCKRIKERDDLWTNIDEYIARHSDTEFSHGICPECLKKHYPEIARLL